MPQQEAENLVLRLTDPRTPSHDQVVEDELIKIFHADGNLLAHCLRFLAHKVQSPCEREAISALNLLESLAKRGGRPVQAELGKFRFLNELIKVVSPKYLGEKSAEAVKKRTIEMLFLWSQSIRYEQKIVEAYTMLKQQGIVKEDPAHILEPPPPPPAPRAKNPVIEDDEKARLLRRLLQSKDPSDMVAANRLIKSMVREDDQRMEKIIRRHSDLIQIKENAKLLLDMLKHFSSDVSTGDVNTSDVSTIQEREVMRQLFNSCEQHRPRVFKLAAEIVESNTETEDGPNLADILATSDELTEVIQKYRALGLTSEKFGVTQTADEKQASSNVLFSLDGAPTIPSHNEGTSSNTAATSMKPTAPPSTPTPSIPTPSIPTPSAPPSGLKEGLKEESLLSLLEDVFSAPNVSVAPVLPLAPPLSIQGTAGMVTVPSTAHVTPQPPKGNSNGTSPVTSRRSLVDFDAVTHSFLGGLSLGDMNMKGKSFPAELKPRVTLNDLQRGPPARSSISKDDEILGSSANNSFSDFSSFRSAEISEKSTLENFENISVNLTDIEPYPIDPVMIYQKNKITVVFHLAKNKPRSDCLVFVASASSQNALPVKNFALTFFAPKSTKIKVQPASTTDIPAHSPFFPSAPLSQIVLVSKTGQNPLRLQYQLAYSLDGQTIIDNGDVSNIPEIQL